MSLTCTFNNDQFQLQLNSVINTGHYNLVSKVIDYFMLDVDKKYLDIQKSNVTMYQK